jgi:hypothetical protein
MKENLSEKIQLDTLKHTEMNLVKSEFSTRLAKYIFWTSITNYNNEDFYLLGYNAM